jgi:curved DNA-binding protein CbpA
MSIYHQILGVSENASDLEIKSKYRDLCKKYHPDISDNESIDKMALINEAYSYLNKSKTITIENESIRGENNKINVVRYKDQAYAFYKQGIKIFNEVKSYPRTFAMYHNNETVEDFQCKVLKALYYFNIVCVQFEKCEWSDDSIDKIRQLNRDRSFIKNIRDYLERSDT